VLQLNHAIAGKTEPFEHVNIDWNFVLVNSCLLTYFIQGWVYNSLHPAFELSVLWRCWLGGRKGIRPVKNWVVGCWHGVCLERGADLHMSQLMPLPLTVSCSSKIQIGLPFWYRLTWVVPEKEPLNGCVCVCSYSLHAIHCVMDNWNRVNLCRSCMAGCHYCSWHCSHAVWSRIFASVGRPSVCLSQQELSIDCCTAHSSAAGECGQCHVVSIRSSWTRTCLK